MTWRSMLEGMELLKSVQPALDLSTWDPFDVMAHDKLLVALMEEGPADSLYCTLSDESDADPIATAGSRLKCISTTRVGFNDVAAAKAAGTKVGFTPEVLTDVPEIAIGVAPADASRRRTRQSPTADGERESRLECAAEICFDTRDVQDFQYLDVWQGLGCNSLVKLDGASLHSTT